MPLWQHKSLRDYITHLSFHLHPTYRQGAEEFRAAATEATLIFISATLQVVYFPFLHVSPTKLRWITVQNITIYTNVKQVLPATLIL